jgi:hypothetical protein
MSDYSIFKEKRMSKSKSQEFLIYKDLDKTWLNFLFFTILFIKVFEWSGIKKYSQA